MRSTAMPVLTIVLVAIVLSSVKPVPAAPGWAQFVHPQLGFALSYPQEWTVARGVTGVAFMVVGPSPAGVRDVRLNVNVTAEQLSAGITAEAFDGQNESGLGMLFHEYRRLRTDRTQVVGFAAMIRYYTWKRNDGIEIYQLQLSTVAGTRGYVVTGTTASVSSRLQVEARLLQSILLTFRPR